ncbi:S-adenosyl-L-methionine-dependent methyltransferase [Sarocladium strictum]
MPKAEVEPKSTEQAAPDASPQEANTGILPAQHWVEQAAAVTQEDTDSFISERASTTASLSSSILDYRTIHGRRYHSTHSGNGEYWAANDDAQNESLDIIHHMLTLLLDGELCKAPIKDNIQKVVDIGTGTGTWAIDFADKYPNASVIGTELSPIQPSWIPPNLEFQIDDCTSEWTFAENSIDFIHIRWLFGSIQDWDVLFAQAYRCLKPGGWIESHEASVQFRSDDGSVNDKTAMGQFGRFFIEAGRQMGRSMTVVEDGVQRQAIEKAGFVGIHEQDYKVPMGPWPKDPKQKEIGAYQRLAVEQDPEGTLVYVTGMAGWSQKELHVYIAHLRREFRDPGIHGHYFQKIVWAQKPE